VTNPGVFPGGRNFDSRRISLLNEEWRVILSFLLIEGVKFLSDRKGMEVTEMAQMDEGAAFMIRLCSDRAAYEAVPKKRLKVDLTRVKVSLERGGDCEIALWTPQLMVIKQKNGVEITIVDDGRLIIRNVADEDTAQEIAETLCLT
jgi:hypothetical protein